jgi:anaphase-promoting complex subunit 1
MTVNLFDDRFDGKQHRVLICICLPVSKLLRVFTLAHMEDRTAQITPLAEMHALSAASVRATRANVWDLLVVKPQGKLSLLVQDMRQIPVQLHASRELTTTDTEMDMPIDHHSHGMIVSATDAFWGNVTLRYEDDCKSLITFDIFPQDKLVTECFQLLALTLPSEVTFEIRQVFLDKWCERAWSTVQNLEFDCFSSALLQVFGLEVEDIAIEKEPWLKLGKCSSHSRFSEDPVLRSLETPPSTLVSRPLRNNPNPMMAPLLYGLHTLAEHLRLSISRQKDLLKFVPLVCRIAVAVRPEWADYWKRLVPDATTFWPSSLMTCKSRHHYAKSDNSEILIAPELLNDRIPVWPPDLSAVLYGRLSTPDWKVHWHDVQHILSRFPITPSFDYGVIDPLRELHELSLLYNTLSDGKVVECQKRAENTVYRMVTHSRGRDVITDLPLGIAAPLLEAARTCQLAPPGNWPFEAYKAIGRNDLATSAIQNQDVLVSGGYKTRKESIVSSRYSHDRLMLMQF